MLVAPTPGGPGPERASRESTDEEDTDTRGGHRRSRPRCVDFADALAQSAEREPVSIAQFDRWMDELSNWGRWGDDDQIGAANLMTDEKRREAAALVRTGTTVSLSHDFLTEEAADAAEPYVLQMNVNPAGAELGRPRSRSTSTA